MATAPTRAEFLASIYGVGFSAAPAATIDAAIAAANRRTSSLYQDANIRADAVCIRAALLLLKTPAGQQMRQSDGLELAWERELGAVQRAGMIGLRTF